MNADDFLKGQKDCRDGIPHESGKSEDYNRGYATQYELEQVKDWFSERKENVHIQRT